MYAWLSSMTRIMAQAHISKCDPPRRAALWRMWFSHLSPPTPTSSAFQAPWDFSKSPFLHLITSISLCLYPWELWTVLSISDQFNELSLTVSFSQVQKFLQVIYQSNKLMCIQKPTNTLTQLLIMVFRFLPYVWNLKSVSNHFPLLSSFLVALFWSKL